MLNAPYSELAILLRAVTGAEWLELLGYPAMGYELLMGHLHRAEEAEKVGCPWALEFVAAYRLAVKDYLRSAREAGQHRRAT